MVRQKLNFILNYSKVSRYTILLHFFIHNRVIGVYEDGKTNYENLRHAHPLLKSKSVIQFKMESNCSESKNREWQNKIEKRLPYCHNGTAILALCFVFI
jgi:hypothetical protein